MAADPPIAIYGLVRDAAESLPAGLRAVEALRAALPGSTVLVATNDNVDRTGEILAAWADPAAGRELMVLDGLAASLPNRIDRLATARNLCLRRIRESCPDETGFVIAIDLDGPNANLDATALADRVRRWPADWSGAFANSRQAYYDLYALRRPGWCPNDCMVEIEAAVRFPLRTWKRRRANRRYIYERQYRIAPSTPPIEVHSAFGGLAIYRRQALRDCWYGSREPGGEVVCEHVVLHRQMRARGGRLFILPDLLNDAPPEHLGPGSGAPFPEHLLG